VADCLIGSAIGLWPAQLLVLHRHLDQVQMFASVACCVCRLGGSSCAQLFSPNFSKSSWFSQDSSVSCRENSRWCKGTTRIRVNQCLGQHPNAISHGCSRTSNLESDAMSITTATIQSSEEAIDKRFDAIVFSVVCCCCCCCCVSNSFCHLMKKGRNLCAFKARTATVHHLVMTGSCIAFSRSLGVSSNASNVSSPCSFF
jgi:hypothetical protein